MCLWGGGALGPHFHPGGGLDLDPGEGGRGNRIWGGAVFFGVLLGGGSRPEGGGPSGVFLPGGGGWNLDPGGGVGGGESVSGRESIQGRPVHPGGGVQI